MQPSTKNRINLPRTLLRHTLKLTLTLVVVIGVLWLNAERWLPAIGHWLAYPTSVQPADAIAVYGGGVNRTLHGIDHYHAGLAPEFWHTGYPFSRSQVVTLVVEENVPAENISYLASDSTWEDGREIAAFAQEHDTGSLLLVTDWWHSHRAMCAVKHHLGDSDIQTFFDAPPIKFGPDDWWQHKSGRRVVFSELGKLGFYWVRYGMWPWGCE